MMYSILIIVLEKVRLKTHISLISNIYKNNTFDFKADNLLIELLKYYKYDI